MFLSALVVLVCEEFCSPEKITTPLQLTLFTVRQPDPDVHFAYKRLSCQLFKGVVRQVFGIRPVIRLPTAIPDVSVGGVVLKLTVTGGDAHAVALLISDDTNVLKSLRFLIALKILLLVMKIIWSLI